MMVMVGTRNAGSCPMQKTLCLYAPILCAQEALRESWSDTYVYAPPRQGPVISLLTHPTSYTDAQTFR